MKKVYVKPQIERVRLLAEEAVLASGCKTATTTSGESPGIPSTQGCVLRNCSAIDGT